MLDPCLLLRPSLLLCCVGGGRVMDRAMGAVLTHSTAWARSTFTVEPPLSLSHTHSLSFHSSVFLLRLLQRRQRDWGASGETRQGSTTRTKFEKSEDEDRAGDKLCPCKTEWYWWRYFQPTCSESLHLFPGKMSAIMPALNFNTEPKAEAQRHPIILLPSPSKNQEGRSSEEE